MSDAKEHGLIATITRRLYELSVDDLMRVVEFVTHLRLGDRPKTTWTRTDG